MRKLVTLMMLLSASWAYAQSADSMDKAANAPLETKSAARLAEQSVYSVADEVEQKWIDFLSERGLSHDSEKDSEVYLEEGEDETIRIAKGSAIVNYRPEDGDGFLRSRIVSFYRAFQRAKNKLIQSIEADISTSQSYQDLNAAGIEPDPSLSQLDRILKKSGDFAEKTLDKAIVTLDPTYDPRAYTEREQKLAKAREVTEAHTRIAARRAVAGAMPAAVLEGGVSNSRGGKVYRVIVGLAWSPEMRKDALAVIGRHKPAKGERGPGVGGKLPKTVGEAAASWGVSRTTDKNGNRILIAYGQSVVKDHPSAIEFAKSEESAKRSARIRAVGALREFAGEIISSVEDDTLAESRIIDEHGGREIEQIDRVRTYYKSKADARHISGIVPIGEWIIRHPSNDKPLAVVAVKWSEATRRQSKSLKHSIQTGRETKKKIVEKKAVGKREQTRGNVILQRSNID